ncbi:MAG: LytTR family DNA-binding domain-containing protein [Bacteroidota bacterium]
MIKLRTIFKSPYHRLTEKRRRVAFALADSGFVWFFLFVFGVFEFNYFSPAKRFLLAGVYSLACFMAMSIHFFMIQDYLIKQLTIGNTILLICSMVVAIGTFNFCLTTLLFQWEPFSLAVLLKNQTHVLAIGTIVAPFLILIHHNYLLKRKAGIRSPSGPFVPDMVLTLRSQYGKEKLVVDVEDLLFIQAADNYIDVYYQNGTSVKRQLLRNTLGAIADELDHPMLMRCHRSYLVNLQHIRPRRPLRKELRIESGGTSYTIPVSRTYREELALAVERFY